MSLPTSPDRPASRFVLPTVLASLVLLGGAPGADAAEVPLVLDSNFNGMVHPGEEGQPDAPDGFRAISDRALLIDGGAMAFGDTLSPASGLSYDVVDAAGVLDILHLGDRNTVDGGNWAFDASADADNIGIQPSWLPDSDQTTTLTMVSPGLLLDDAARVGILYQISNGGGDFDVTLGFADATSVTVTLNGPDWFGPFAGTPDSAGPGVSLQENLGVDFSGAGSVDSGSAAEPLIVTEAVLDAAALLADLGFDVNGRVLTDITFDNPSNTGAGHAILAITVVSADEQAAPGIPALGPAGLLALGLLLALAGGLVLRRRSGSVRA